VPLHTGTTRLEPVALDKPNLLANNMAELYLEIHQNGRMEGKQDWRKQPSWPQNLAMISCLVEPIANVL
jgi:hypothetical protein